MKEETQHPYSFRAWLSLHYEEGELTLSESGRKPSVATPSFRKDRSAKIKSMGEEVSVWMVYPRTKDGTIVKISPVYPLKNASVEERRETFSLYGVVVAVKRDEQDRDRLLQLHVFVDKNEDFPDRNPFTASVLLLSRPQDGDMALPPHIPETGFRLSRTQAQTNYSFFCKINGVIRGGRLYATEIEKFHFVERQPSSHKEDRPGHKAIALSKPPVNNEIPLRR